MRAATVRERCPSVPGRRVGKHKRATSSSPLDDDDQAVHYFVELGLGNVAGTIDDNARIGRE